MPESQGRRSRVGLFLNTSEDRRKEFLASCAESFDRLFMADSIATAATLLAQHSIDLMVLDLSGCEARHGNSLAAMGELVRSRAGKTVLVLCPYGNSGWLPELMACGPLSYRISPILAGEMCQAIDAMLAHPLDPAATAQQKLLDKEAELRDLLALQRGVQRALGGTGDLVRMAEQACAALCSYPGVNYAALLRMGERGDLRLLAQDAHNKLDLTQLLGRSDHLLESPLRDMLPPLLAVSTGELVLLDAPEKTGDPELAVTLHTHAVRMVLGLPLHSEPGGPVQGALCLAFDRPIELSREHFAAFSSVAQFTSFGLAMCLLREQNDALSSRLQEASPHDALTGAFNRRHGEQLLDAEIRRSRRYGSSLALLSFDIDNFRAVNDLYGYPIGDQALRVVAGTVQARLRQSDTLVRMRGEQFMIVATHTSAIDALKLGEVLRETIAETDLPRCDTVTISVGVAQLAPQESAQELLGRLDNALYRAKRAGRNCVELAMAH